MAEERGPITSPINRGKRRYMLKIFKDTGERRLLNWSPQLEKDPNCIECDENGIPFAANALLAVNPLDEMSKKQLLDYAKKIGCEIDGRSTKRQIRVAIKTFEAEKREDEMEAEHEKAKATEE